MIRVALLSFLFAAIAVCASASTGTAAEQDGTVAEAETAFWDSVKNSADPAELQAYLDAYPDGHYAALANIRMKKLGKSADEKAAAPKSANTNNGLEPNTKVMPELASTDVGFAGIDAATPTAAQAAAAGLSAPRGALIVGVNPIGPAKKAGLKRGDLILRVDGEAISNHFDFVRRMRAKAPGETVAYVIKRDGKEQELSFNVGALGRDMFDAATAGDAVSMHWLAKLLDRGDVFKRDIPGATKWYRAACKADHAKACQRLGARYEVGVEGLKKDVDEAARWFTRGAELGDAESMSRMAKLWYLVEGHPHDFDKAIAWYQKAIDANGHTGALNNLAAFYLGDHGVPKDLDKHFRLMKRAAEGGQVESIINLGRAYKYGWGVSKNTGEALKLWTKAGNLGNGIAWRFTAHEYEVGGDVVKDRDKAIAFYRKAAALGDQESIDKLKELGVSAHEPSEVQRLLAELGYDPGPIDGKVGAQVRQAIRKFEKDQSLPVTGEASFELQKMLAQVQAKRRRNSFNVRPTPKASNKAKDNSDLERLD